MGKDSVDSAGFNPTGIVARIAAGDPAAEAELVSYYYDSLRFTLKRQYRDEQLRQDVVQETFTRVLLTLRGKSINKPEALASFVHSTARNLVYEYLRQESRFRSSMDTEEMAQMPEMSLDQGKMLEDAERNQMVRGVIEELAQPRDREILLRFYLEDEEKSSICSALSLTPGQFDRVIHRARGRLKQQFQSRFGDYMLITFLFPLLIVGCLL